MREKPVRLPWARGVSVRRQEMRIPFTDLAATHSTIVDEIIEAIRGTAKTSRFAGGSHVERFEAAWAGYCGARYAVGVANGSDAIELTGATPRFVDVDPGTLLVTPETLEAGSGQAGAAPAAERMAAACTTAARAAASRAAASREGR